MPNLLTEEVKPQATSRGVVESAISFVGGIVPDVTPNPRTLTGVRGIEPDRHLALESLIRSSSFAEAHRAELSRIWVEARLDPTRDQGKDLQTLLPLLEKNPELLSQLYKVATADSLFGQKRTASNAESFDKLRREYLAELVRGACDSHAITQGPGAMCTAASMLKAIPSAELLRLGTAYALDGHVQTQSGKEMVMRPEFLKRAEISANASIEDLKCRRPSAGMLMLLDGVIELGVPDTTQQQGSYWWQYTDAWRDLRGRESVCAGREAKINIDSDGQAVASGGVKTVSNMEYLVDRLRQNNKDEGQSGVLIDTKWNHSSRSTGSESMHGRHMLKAVGIVQRHGAEYIVCENPIGDFVDVSKSYKGHAEFMPAGAVLGDKNGFWFETGENGTVYIRKDVLSNNLQTVLVDYKERYVAGSGNRPQGLGMPVESEAQLIHFVKGDEPAQKTDTSIKAVNLSAIEPSTRSTQANVVVKKKVEEPHSGHAHAPDASRKGSKEEDELLGYNPARDPKDSKSSRVEADRKEGSTFLTSALFK